MLFRKKEYDDSSLLNMIYQKNRLVRYAQFIVGIVLLAIAFNTFLLPNNVVYGMGGLGVIFYRTFGTDPSLVIMIGSMIALVLSFIFLGTEKTKASIVGSFSYPILVKLTEPITSYINLGETEAIVVVLFGAIICGFGYGLVFKAGFTTGGTDIFNQLVSKYCKMSIGNAMFFTDGLIILTGLFALGWQKFIYSVFSMYIISMITDKVILGISQSKCFYIITEHETAIKKFMLDYLSHGVTVLEARGGYTGNRLKVIMCIIPTKEYFLAKEAIKNIDPDAFFLVTDSYEVGGGA